MKVAIAALAALLALSPIYAKHHHKGVRGYGSRTVSKTVSVGSTPTTLATWPFNSVLKPVQAFSEQVSRVIAQALPHPSGCPPTAFCGCGAAADLGLHDRSLWLAANWFRFPRSTPAPNTAAVRRHHVFVLKQHIAGSVWLVADYNSGHHRSALHERSISGYTIVNPRG